tara:strand:- start:20058 stop:20237 length:180 start_codon:yes stop_codon:yes gene_type:complete
VAEAQVLLELQPMELQILVEVEVEAAMEQILLALAVLALSSFHTQTYMRRQQLQQVHQL